MVTLMRTLLRPVLACALALAASAAPSFAATSSPPAASNVSKLYEDALQRYNQQDHRGAMIQLKTALQRNPRDLPSLILMGKVFLKLGYAHAAEEQLKRARGAGADDSQILAPLANAYLAQGKYDILLKEVPRGIRPPDIEAEILSLRGQALLEMRETARAEEHFADALKLKRDYAPALLGRANAAMVRGAYEEADELVNRVVAITPDEPDAWYAKGEVRRMRQDLKGGLVHLEKAISLKPGHLPARISRAAILIELDRLDEAEKEIQTVRQKLPKDPESAVLHAMLLARKNNIAGAQEILRTAGQWLDLRDPEFVRRHPQSLLLSGVINYAQERYDEALPFLYRYVEAVPNHAGARKLLGSILLKNGDLRGAIQSLEAASNFAPDDTETLTLLGNAYSQARDYTNATAAYEKAIKLAPKQATLHTQLAITRLAVGHNTKAITDLETAFQLEGKDGRAGPLLALVHLQRGDYEAVHKITARLIEQDPRNPVPYNFDGAAYMRTSEDDKARAKYEKAIEVDPKYTPARFNLALLHLRQRDYAGARQRYNEVLAISPSDTQAMTELARVAELEQKTEEAIRWLDQVRKTEPGSLAPQLRLVDLYMRTKNTREALQILDQLEIDNPRSLEVFDAKGRVQASMGEQAKAVETYRRASNLAANTAQGLHDVARAQLRLQDLDGARISLQSAIRLEPNFMPAYSTLVEISIRDGGLDRAMEVVGKVREQDPTSAVSDLLHGDALVLAGRPADALAPYQRAFDKEQSSRMAIRIYRARHGAGDKEAALEFLKSWVARHPEDLPARRALAAAYLDGGRYEQSVREHEALLEKTPDDVALANNLAWLYLRQKDPRARQLAERMYRMAPDNAAMLDTYGWILVQAGEAARALPLLREANARAAQRPEVRFHIGAALAALGREEEARQELEASLALGAVFQEAADARALLEKIQGKR